MSDKWAATFFPLLVPKDVKIIDPEAYRVPIWLDEAGAHEVDDRTLCDPIQAKSIFEQVWLEGVLEERYDDIEDELYAIEQRS